MTLEKRFRKEFAEPMEFWTSEDGSLISVAVSFSRNWVKLLAEAVELRGEKFAASKVKVRYAYREWAEPGYFYFKGEKGKVWRLGEDKTPFQVYEYEFENPK